METIPNVKPKICNGVNLSFRKNIARTAKNPALSPTIAIGSPGFGASLTAENWAQFPTALKTPATTSKIDKFQE